MMYKSICRSAVEYGAPVCDFKHELEASPGDSPEWSSAYRHGQSPHGQHCPFPPIDKSAAISHALWSVDKAIYISMSCARSPRQQTSQQTSTATVDKKWSGHAATVLVWWISELRREVFHNKGIQKLSQGSTYHLDGTDGCRLWAQQSTEHHSTRNWLVINRAPKEGSHFRSTVEIWLLCLAKLL